MKNVNLTINGKAVAVPEGTTILDAAKQNGIISYLLCAILKMFTVTAAAVFALLKSRVQEL